MSEHKNPSGNDEVPIETPCEAALALSKQEENDQKTNSDKPDGPDSQDERQRRSSKPVVIAIGGWDSLWLIALLVFGLIFLWNAFYQSPRYEIPIMLLIKLVEQGNPDRELNATTTKPTGSQTIPYIIVEEGKDKKARKVKYSQLNDISIAPYEVTGKVIREVLSLANDEKPDPVQARPQEVDFFSGRQGIPFDNNELFNYFKKNGFENVSAKGPPGFFESYGVAIFTTLILLFILFYLFQRLGAGAMALGRNRDIQVSPEDIEVSFQDVAGVDEAVDELREIVEFLQRPEKFSLLGGRIPKGVLLVGPPGTGKTLLAKAVAGEAGVPFFSLSGSDFVEIYAGVGAARVRDLFQLAQRSAPCIVFIDELDALGKTRSGTSLGGHDEREQTLNALLVEMDGFGTNSGTIIIAATNRPEILDSALLRSGRFDRQVLVDRPDIAGREDILRIHSKQVKLSDDIDLHQIASITSGFVGADLAALVNEAALLAARSEKSSVTMDEFTEAVERVTTGLQKKRRVMTDSEKRRVSWHECGHAIVATLLPHSDPVHKVSIIPRGLAALGYTLQRPEDEHFLMTKLELESRIQTLLAGTIAEEIAFSDISTGAQNDLERASEIARNMVMCFGMSHMGKINYHESRSTYLTENSYVSTRLHSEETAWKIDQEVQAIIEEMYRRTKEMLTSCRDKLDRLATRLLEKEVIDSDELKAIIGEDEKSNGGE